MDLKHSFFSGKADDDHIIYLKADGTRALTGDLSAGTKKITDLNTPTADGDLTRKSYVDGKQAAFQKDAFYGVTGTNLGRINETWGGELPLEIAINSTDDKIFVSGYCMFKWNEFESPFEEGVNMALWIGGALYAIGHRKWVTNMQAGYEQSQTISLSFYATGLSPGNHVIYMYVRDDNYYATTRFYNRSISVIVVRA